MTGVVLTQDTDPRKQFPVRNARITALWGDSTATAISDNTGLFRLDLTEPTSPEQTDSKHPPPIPPVTLQFRHSDYQPLDRTESAGDHLYVARMTPISRANRQPSDKPEILIANLRVRYSVKLVTTQNVASLSRAFEIVNKGNVPCNDKPPCSPDGKWKANLGTVEVDAGEGNEFRTPRVSCIAGPCPFARPESNETDSSGQHLKVSVLNWSDTTTFLIEAEITHTMVSNLVRLSYPVIFGDAMDFTLPAGAEGPSIQADLNGNEILFPLGPELLLSWATCTTKVGSDRSTLYRCEVKPGYRYKQ